MVIITRPSSEWQIAELYHQYLCSLPESDCELEPTLENAEAYTKAVLAPAWERGEPILIAISKSRVVGATFTTIASGPIKYKIPTAFGHGTWVAPDFRGKGVCTQLIAEVRRMLREKGITRQIGTAHLGNPQSVAAFKRLGFVEHGVTLRADI